MKIALFGADGQVGRETLDAATNFAALDIIPLRRENADLATPGAAAEALRRLNPAAVINAAAWTAVDKAETEIDGARRINAYAVGEIAAACKEIGARLVHLSTDYVFAGDPAPAPLSENAAPSPINVYGATKLQGEDLARAANPDTVILRTSWVYSAHGANFVKTMLRLSQSMPEIKVVADQIGGPTPAAAIATACLTIAGANDGPAGLYHFQGAPAVSWADFAQAIFAAGGRQTKVDPIATIQYPTPAKRPKFTVLNCSKIRRDYGLEQPDWRTDLARTVGRLDSLASQGN
ncbi:MAG: dTDP-4-dehydrorhamnose reductase [Alphaproteobacteria bacterium RIFCSPHIGHO2_12_FULL_63_12]|nr:MAG: dTDP-4-dehydrorhamnose reductase [Alphaproteobacteria bacterium RIFCSPHIGHO2_12_FULL_63_12]